MKYASLCLFLLGSYGGSSFAHADGRRHKDIEQATTSDPGNNTTSTTVNTLTSPISLETPSSAISWNSTSVNTKDEKDKKCYDVYSDGSIHEVSCSDGNEKKNAYDAAYFAKVVALGLLAGAVLVR